MKYSIILPTFFKYRHDALIHYNILFRHNSLFVPSRLVIFLNYNFKPQPFKSDRLVHRYVSFTNIQFYVLRLNFVIFLEFNLLYCALHNFALSFYYFIDLN